MQQYLLYGSFVVCFEINLNILHVYLELFIETYVTEPDMTHSYPSYSDYINCELQQFGFGVIFIKSLSTNEYYIHGPNVIQMSYFPIIVLFHRYKLGW